MAKRYFSKRRFSRKATFRRSRRAIGQRTTAMPITSLARPRLLPRGMGYSYLPDVMRAKFNHSSTVFYIQGPPTQVDTAWGGLNFACFPVRASLSYSGQNGGVPAEDLSLPFQFNRLLTIYGQAQVDYVTYSIQVVDSGYTSSAGGLTITAPTPQIAARDNYFDFASAIISSSDYDTFNAGAGVATNPAILSQARGGRISAVHSGGNHDVVTHKHSLDLGSWFKEPSNDIRRLTSNFAANQPANFSPTIARPANTGVHPVLCVSIRNTSIPLFASLPSNFYVRAVLKATYHVSFSSPHQPSYIFPN